MTAPPDTRVLRILRWLLAQDRPRSTASLGDALGLSQRVIRYRLDAVASFLDSRDLELIRQRGAGLYVEGPDVARETVREELAEYSTGPRVYARGERERILLSSLLRAAPDPISLHELGQDLEVSTASARRDLKRIEAWLTNLDLVLVRHPGVGVSVIGPESKVRQALVQLLLEAIPGDVLLELCDRPVLGSRLAEVRVPVGLREHLAQLELHRTAGVITERIFLGALDERHSEMIISLYLAVSAARIRLGHTLTMEAGRQRSLSDHPVSLTAGTLAAAFAEAYDLELRDAEVAGITEYLLGLAAIADQSGSEENHYQGLLDDILEVAGHRIHPTLGVDLELRRNLAQHLERLAVRLRYGLPVHNPLLAEVTERYPDIHSVARDLGSMISEHFVSSISDDEIGYLTMYLSGALERTRLRPTRRACVVCPSGMATAWVLVSRIQTEFPQLELTKVMSARAYMQLDVQDIDVVISTVEIDRRDVPVVVVSPLLTPSDVRRIVPHL